MTKPVIVVIGAQGSGKSTQTEAISQQFNLPIFEMGQSLREAAGRDPELQKVMKSGQLVENSRIVAIIEDYLVRNPAPRGLILDGFPRDLEQCHELYQLMAKYDWRLITVQISISDQTAKERLSQRTIEVDGQLQRRADDQPGIVEQRLRVFHARTEPLLAALKVRGEFVAVDGEPPAEQVTESIIGRLKQLINE